MWLTPNTRVPYSKDVKRRNPLKFAGVPQTTQSISAAGGPKFTILFGHNGGDIDAQRRKKFCVRVRVWRQMMAFNELQQVRGIQKKEDWPKD